MAFEDHTFDVRKLWERPANDQEHPKWVGEEPRPTNEAALRLALAAMVVGVKNTAGAARRCRKRLTRARGKIASAAKAARAPPDASELAVKAAAWLACTCSSCGKCPGP